MVDKIRGNKLFFAVNELSRVWSIYYFSI